MFSQLSERLQKVIKTLSGQGRLTPENIKETLRDVRIALLEADVALPVAKEFIAQIEAKALGAEVLHSLTPGQVLIELVNQELTKIMGEYNESLNLKAEPPVVILMAGLQGSGKTTTSAKLARFLIEQKKSVLLVSTDIYRPAAIEQLKILAETVGAQFFPSTIEDRPEIIAKSAIKFAKDHLIDVLIIDTAGRLHIDDNLMQEIKQIHQVTTPTETLFVVDSMTGQDAANTAKAFNEALALTGVILTKTDGDARGGAALSIRQITGKPIKFIGIGEKIEALSPFYPDRMASRILGMGDILSLVEEAKKKIDKSKAEKLVKKIKKGKVFDLEDFRDQIKQIHHMGGMAGILSKLPGVNQLPPMIKDQLNDKKLKKTEAIINSMTKQERRFPDRIRSSQKRRITQGSGCTIQDLNQVLKQFKQMQGMMRKMADKGGMAKLMRLVQSKLPFGGGGLPPGLMGG